jgi:hypothetical protein
MVFMIPTNPTEDADYTTSAALSDGALIDCQAYSFDEDTQVVKLLVVRGPFSYEEGGTIVKDSVAAIVDNVYRRVNGETDEAECGVAFYQYDSYERGAVRTGSALEQVVLGMSVGDVFKYSLNSLGYIDNIEIVAKNIAGMQPYYTGISDQEESSFGYVYRFKENWLKANSNVPSDLIYVSTDAAYNDYKVFSLETGQDNAVKSPMYCIDNVKKTVYPLEGARVRSGEESNAPDLAYVYSRNAAAQVVVIVKN